MSANTAEDLRRIYSIRFEKNLLYRERIWSALIADFFSRLLDPSGAVLDLGCGYGEFINHAQVQKKYAMDLNPDAPRHLDPSVTFLQQDCSTRWNLSEACLNNVFTSNFFEHLPDKAALGRTLDEIKRCLVPGGTLIAMGPNIKFLPGTYWEFWDHHLPLTENSLAEALTSRGFTIKLNYGKFLPYTMATGIQYPPAFLRLYLKIPIAWKIFGKQFLVVAEKN